MRIGIVILNYNTSEETINCYESIINNCKSRINEYFFYIVDNCSKDDSVGKLNEFFGTLPYVKVIVSDKNLGFSGGNNLGIRNAHQDGCESVFLLNSDIIVGENAIDLMNTLLFSNDSLMVVGPYLTNRNGIYSQFARKGLCFKSLLLDGKLLQRISPRRAFNSLFFSYDKEEDYIFGGMVSGCCFGAKTAFLMNNNFLDSNIFLYYEEDTFAHVLNRLGLKCGICSQARVVHLENVSATKEMKEKYCFTRFYRWVSSLYVLYVYARTPLLICKLVSIANCTIWCFFSIFKKTYRMKLRAFLSNNKKVFKDGKRRIDNG